jgi:predicted Zn-dependent peptidase
MKAYENWGTRQRELALPLVRTMTLVELADEYANIIMEEEEGYTFTATSVDNAKQAILEELQRREDPKLVYKYFKDA